MHVPCTQRLSNYSCDILQLRKSEINKLSNLTPSRKHVRDRRKLVPSFHDETNLFTINYNYLEPCFDGRIGPIYAVIENATTKKECRIHTPYLFLACSRLSRKIGGHNGPKNFAAKVSGNLHFDSIRSKDNKIFNERTIARYSVKYAERRKATIIARYGSFLNEPLLSRPLVRERGNTGQTSSYPLTNPEIRS